MLSDASGGDEQYQLNQFLAEHASLFGLKVKVLKRSDFTTGVVFHQDLLMMKRILSRDAVPYMFHMSWTVSKTDKLFYLKQMGEWFVKERCIGVTLSTILNSSSRKKKGSKFSIISPCCSARPLISCHFRDKPSLIVCNDSQLPAKDVGGASFW